ncbi:PREDICTED: uncharacterized protein C11orf24-like [Cyprinodon variegatus]|uniref:Prostate androgen-regulated mucin-like protein 1 n=1 Tax=Cyprinodon variegatus TaxID=28743 RepID=A0A3Q2FMG0_CYPVA|nr:PREDICTED: uncharacterized protein C11orf24-like [Cyprinodon variegatus]
MLRLGLPLLWLLLLLSSASLPGFAQVSLDPKVQLNSTETNCSTGCQDSGNGTVSQNKTAEGSSSDAVNATQRLPLNGTNQTEGPVTTEGPVSSRPPGTEAPPTSAAATPSQPADGGSTTSAATAVWTSTPLEDNRTSSAAILSSKPPATTTQAPPTETPSAPPPSTPSDAIRNPPTTTVLPSRSQSPSVAPALSTRKSTPSPSSSSAAASARPPSRTSAPPSRVSVVEEAGAVLTRQLVDTASLIAVLLFGLLFFLVTVAVFATQAYESYRRKDYTQVDYLINGMYSDSSV